MQFDEGELRCPVDSHEQIEAPFGGADLSDIDVEVADRVSLELAPLRLCVVDLRPPRDAVAAQAAVERRPGQMREGRLEGVETIVKRQQRVTPEESSERSKFYSCLRAHRRPLFAGSKPQMHCRALNESKRKRSDWNQQP